MQAEMSIPEVLRAALVSLNDPNSIFDFGSFAHCTCGHIYLAATGRRSGECSASHGVPLPPLYEKVIYETAMALGMPHDYLRDFGPTRRAAYYVSNYTSQRRVGDYVDRSVAIRVIKKALKTIEDAEAEAMLQVASQRKTVARKQPSETVAPARLSDRADA